MPIPAAIVAAAKAARKARQVDRATGGGLSKIAGYIGGGMGLFLVLGIIGFAAPSTEAQAEGACPVGAGVPSSVQLEQPTIDGINGLKATYEKVAAAKGLSWTLLAAIDYRESGNDPNRSSAAGEPLGSANPDHEGLSFATKEDSLNFTADTLRAGASDVYGVALTAESGGDDVKNAIVAYGRWAAYKTAGVASDTSPYVMNRYDADHWDMVYPSIPGETLAGMTEYRYGAFTVFTRLGGSAAGGCGGLSNVAVVRIAQGEVGVAEEGCDDCGPPLKYQGSTGPEDWCADFVSWVYAEAGSPFTGGMDGGWRLPGVDGVHQWLSANGFYEARSTTSTARPGDVIFFGNDDHVGLVESVDDSGTPLEFGDDIINTIEGNSAQSVIRHSYPTTDTYVLGWGRMRQTAPV